MGQYCHQKERKNEEMKEEGETDKTSFSAKQVFLKCNLKAEVRINYCY